MACRVWEASLCDLHLNSSQTALKNQGNYSNHLPERSSGVRWSEGHWIEQITACSESMPKAVAAAATISGVSCLGASCRILQSAEVGEKPCHVLRTQLQATEPHRTLPRPT